MKQIQRSQVWIGLVLVVLSVSHWFPMGIYVMELLGAFAHFTLLTSAAILLFSIRGHIWKLILLSLTSTLICAFLIFPEVVSNTTSDSSEFTIGQINLYHHNDRSTEAFETLRALNCDVLTIQEVNTAWADELATQLQDHPYSIIESWENCCYGIALFSKYPISAHRTVYVDSIPTIIAEINVNGKRMSVLSVHTQSPAFPNRTETRNLQLQELANTISGITGPILVAGDFNIVPWDAVFKKFIRTSGLQRIRSGFQATFPMDLGFPLIPIDHILFNDAMNPSGCRSFNIPGSDHKGLIASFSFSDN